MCESHQTPQGTAGRRPGLASPPPATGYTGPARIQCGRAACSEHTGGGTHGDWLAGGGGHRGCRSPPGGPRQETQKFPSQGSPGDARLALRVNRSKARWFSQDQSSPAPSAPTSVDGKCSTHTHGVPFALRAGLGRGSRQEEHLRAWVSPNQQLRPSVASHPLLALLLLQQAARQERLGVWQEVAQKLGECHCMRKPGACTCD